MKTPVVVFLMLFTFATLVGAHEAWGQGQRPAEINGQNAKPVPPFKIFDNLYYVGIDYVCSYVIKTNAGLIMVVTPNARQIADNIRGKI